MRPDSTFKTSAKTSAGDTRPTDDQPLISEFADDPDMADLVEMFVSELADRVRAIDVALEASDQSTLAQLAHQLKGAAGGYGFNPITDAAAVLEKLAKSEADAANLRAAADELTSLCRRASSRPQ